MKRFLVLFLLLALPLHFSWAVAASCCQHEGDGSAPHFGHHTHQHQVAADDKDEAGKAPLTLHADCSICQLSCAAATVSFPPLSLVTAGSFEFADPPDALPAIFLEGPERPNWLPVA